MWPFKRTAVQQFEHDEYMRRLKNSCRGYCGSRHEGEGPFLSVGDIQRLIYEEYMRRLEAASKAAEEER